MIDFGNKKFENTTQDRIKSAGIGVSVYLATHEYKLLILLGRVTKKSRSGIIKEAINLLGEKYLK